jgi:hypothetical protein
MESKIYFNKIINIRNFYIKTQHIIHTLTHLCEWAYTLGEWEYAIISNFA